MVQISLWRFEISSNTSFHGHDHWYASHYSVFMIPHCTMMHHFSSYCNLGFPINVLRMEAHTQWPFPSNVRCELLAWRDGHCPEKKILLAGQMILSHTPFMVIWLVVPYVCIYIYIFRPKNWDGDPKRRSFSWGSGGSNPLMGWWIVNKGVVQNRLIVSSRTTSSIT